jgi:hypothetical protein
VRESGRDVGLLHESIMKHHPVKTSIERSHTGAFGSGHARHLFGLDIENHVSLVQHVIVLHAVEHGDGHDLGAARQIHRGASYLRFAGRRMDEQFERHRLALELA